MLVIFRAATKGHYEVIRVLASYGADLGKVDADGNMPMHCAAAKGFGQICKFLGQRGESLIGFYHQLNSNLNCRLIY